MGSLFTTHRTSKDPMKNTSPYYRMKIEARLRIQMEYVGQSEMITIRSKLTGPNTVYMSIWYD